MATWLTLTGTLSLPAYLPTWSRPYPFYYPTSLADMNYSNHPQHSRFQFLSSLPSHQSHFDHLCCTIERCEGTPKLLTSVIVTTALASILTAQLLRELHNILCIILSLLFLWCNLGECHCVCITPLCTVGFVLGGLQSYKNSQHPR